jgi:arginine/lysine/ornithine decarboxylase
VYKEIYSTFNNKRRGIKLSELPLLEGVLNYVKENNISFCMPGHKSGKGFYRTSIGKEFLDNINKFDITEVDGVDNLHDQNGIILEASNRLSDFYGSKKSYFLVNGSTSGNMVMIFASLNEGDKVIVERNCHSSILNSIIMRKLVPVYVEDVLSSELNAPSVINMEHFLHIVKNNRDAKAVIVTYPNYYGLCSDLKSIINISRKYGMKVLVDSAHGSHFGVSNNIPESAVKLGADMVVMSAHKTLPSFTQTAYLHVNNEHDISRADLYFHMFLSTSPSYLALCSMDYGRFYLEKYGKNDYDKLISIINVFTHKINSINGMKIVDRTYAKNFKFLWDMDPTRYVINLDRGYSAGSLSKYLRKNKIQIEMNDGSNLVLILSPFNSRDDFERLYEVLKNSPLEKMKSKYVQNIYHKIPEVKITPSDTINRKKEIVGIKDSVGRICGKSVIPYPPGVPIVCPGELIDLNVVKTIEYYRDNKVNLIGIDKNGIEVIS